jgi:hypothetical protein
MIALTVQLKLPAPLGGNMEYVRVELHSGYGSDPRMAHEIISVAIVAGDDEWVRVWGADHDMCAIPRAWVRSWITADSMDTPLG